LEGQTTDRGEEWVVRVGGKKTKSFNWKKKTESWLGKTNQQEEKVGNKQQERGRQEKTVKKIGDKPKGSWWKPSRVGGKLQ